MLPQQNNGGMRGQFGGQHWGSDGNPAKQQRQQPVMGNPSHQSQPQMHQFQLQQMQQQIRSQAHLVHQRHGNPSQQMLPGGGGICIGPIAQQGHSMSNMSNNASFNNVMAQGINPMGQASGMNTNMANATFNGMQQPNTGGIQSQMMGGNGAGSIFSAQQQQAQAALYWNALQASCMTNPAQKIQQMQLQQMQQQSHAMSVAPCGGMQHNNSMNQQQVQMQQLQQLQAGSQGPVNQQGGAPSDSQAQLLLQQQNLIAQLQRQIHQQQQRQQSNTPIASNQPQQLQHLGGQAGNPVSPLNQLGQLGNASSPAVKPQQGIMYQPSQMQYPVDMPNSNPGIMQGLLQQQHRQGNTSQQMHPQHELGSTASLLNLPNITVPSQHFGGNARNSKANEELHLQAMFGNNMQQQSQAPTPSFAHTPLTRPASSVSQSNGTMGTGTPAPSYPGNNSAGTTSIGAPSGVAQLQNPNLGNQQVMEAVRRATSTQPNADFNDPLTQRQQLLLAQMFQQQQMQMGALGNPEEPGQSVLLEQRVKQFQVMQHLQQLQQQKPVADNEAGRNQASILNGGEDRREMQEVGQMNAVSIVSGLGPTRDTNPREDSPRGSHSSASGSVLIPRPTASSPAMPIFMPGAEESSTTQTDTVCNREPLPIDDGMQSIEGVHLDSKVVGSQQSFLDGHFAGGWQSNADLPDRRRIIFSIIKVIERMRPDANRMSKK